ncbi:unnamed protein product [Urochloa humidicola]
MNAAINAALWVVGKALAPLGDTVLEAWAATVKLGPNVEALKVELLLVKAVLEHSQGKETRNSALQLLMHQLQGLAYDAEDVLGELDYFRIHDEIHGTSQAALSEHDAKGFVHSLILNSGHTASAVGRKLLRFTARSSSASSSAATDDPGASSEPSTKQADGEQATGWMPKLASGAYRTIQQVLGKRKRLPIASSSLPHVPDGVGDHNFTPPNVPPSPKMRFNRVDISERMKNIVDKLRPLRQEVCGIIRTLGPGWSTAPNIAESRPVTTSESVEPRLYGRDRLMNSIIHDITSGEYCANNQTVLPIVGPGGIGKTTLTQHIYHSLEVQNHFEVKVWICVSLSFNAHKLIAEIEKCIPPLQQENAGLTAAGLIEQRLKSKRFLLVLDDMWTFSNEDEWKRLLLPFKKSQATGSVIMVTTRFPSLAQMVGTTDNFIKLEGIDREEFKELFLTFIFGDQQESRKNHPLLLETGDKIMDKLKGSPLAAKTVGRLLRNHLHLGHWARVLESKEWESQNGSDDIMPALKLSYDYLPFHLQQCYVYCALFPEDYKFGSEELINFWIGMDILHSGGQNKKVEEIGLSNLNDLVSFGFLKKDGIYGRPHYLIHDLLHDLALKVASQECLIVDHSNVRSVEIQPSLRHLSIVIDLDRSDGTSDENINTEELRKLNTRLKVENLHTLMIFAKWEISSSGRLTDVRLLTDSFNDLLRDADALRLLHCTQYSPPDLSFLAPFHLRYLRLQNMYPTLENMHARKHTVCVSDSCLPLTLSRFYQLRILDLEEWHYCNNWPRDMSNLRNLRHFLTMNDMTTHSDISNVGKVQFLQQLKKFVVNKQSNGFELKQIGNLNELRELDISNLENIHTKEVASEAKLIDKNYINKLTLSWTRNRLNIEPAVEALVLEGLQPHINLAELIIQSHGGTSCPTWLGDRLSVKALQYLSLDGVAWEVFPCFELMPMLQELTLRDMPLLLEFGSDYFSHKTEHSFPCLKRLRLINLQRLGKWVLGEKCPMLSQLEKLSIFKCPELLALPFADNFCYPPRQDQEGRIRWFPKLQNLFIGGCPKIMSVPPIPWTQTLSDVEIENAGSRLLEKLVYRKSGIHGAKLYITGKDGLHLLDEKMLVLNNLTDLQELYMKECPPLELKHFETLTSPMRSELRKFSNNVLVASEREGTVEWQLPAVKCLTIEGCHASGKQLTQFLSHFPKLADVSLRACEKITEMDVEVGLQKVTAPASSRSSVAVNTVEDTEATCRSQQSEVMEVKENEIEEDGLLLLPAHYSEFVQELNLQRCAELRLRQAGGQGGKRRGIQALRCLQELHIVGCPKFFSFYSTSSSSCCPFPSSLKKLCIWYADGMGTLEPLSNLTSLDELEIIMSGGDLRGKGLWPLVTQGQLAKLLVTGCPEFFVGSDPPRTDEGNGLLLQPSSKLQELETDDAAGLLDAPICSLLSSSLTKLQFRWNEEIECFTEMQEKALALLTSLRELRFTAYHKLQCPPAGLHRLPLKRLDFFKCREMSSLPSLPSSLEQLDIRGCRCIKSLPDGGLPSSLRQLLLCDTNEELARQCRKYRGTIPTIYF